MLDNGSGLSRTEGSTALCLGQWLQALWASPAMFDLVASLPLTGVDGTASAARRRRPRARQNRLTVRCGGRGGLCGRRERPTPCGGRPHSAPGCRASTARAGRPVELGPDKINEESCPTVNALQALLPLTPTAIEWIGTCAAILTTGSFIPQAWLIFRTRQVEGISVGMYSAFTAGVALWLTYGVAM